MRKIIQFQEVSPSQYHSGYTMALCDDGTFWLWDSKGWSLMPEQVPQDDIDGLSNRQGYKQQTKGK
jgi:hypothetical protein